MEFSLISFVLGPDKEELLVEHTDTVDIFFMFLG